jgi:hypothetical protein
MSAREKPERFSFVERRSSRLASYRDKKFPPFLYAKTNFATLDFPMIDQEQP